MSDRQPPGGGRVPDGLTPSQTVGPFFAYCLTPSAYDYRQIFSNDLTRDGTAGERIRIEGRVLDGDGAPVPDAMIEIWQADAEGRYPQGASGRNVAFQGFGRTECDGDGRFSFATVKPGPVPGPNGGAQAPHINVGLFARGVLRRMFTRIYFEDEAANSADPILALVPEDARSTLIARRTGAGTYSFDIRLQGDRETVFFEA
jgi:protocatechuate 3,4-dioxygenase alpha subunit